MITLKHLVFKTYLIIKSRSFTFLKFLNLQHLQTQSIYFLRKNNTFIKSKYSKNRQWSKVIVYFGLWFGVISVFAVVYYTYHFIFIFSYLWWVIATWSGLILLVSAWRVKNYLFFRNWFIFN